MKVHNLMANHVATLQLYRTPLISVPAYTIHQTGEYWAHTNKATVEVTIHLGQINVFVCPETGKP